jgi:hypothetical protein
MPTTYPKASYSEMLGLLVLLHSHGDAEDLARLADDLDLEIDEILPSVEFAEALGLIKVQDGRISFAETGSKLVAGTIRERKSILREQLKRTTLFRALLNALESAPDRQLSENEMLRIFELTPAPADAVVQNIINWGRYTELFRYDAEQRVLLPWRARPVRASGGATRPPPPGSPVVQGPAPPEVTGGGTVESTSRGSFVPASG